MGPLMASAKGLHFECGSRHRNHLNFMVFRSVTQAFALQELQQLKQLICACLPAMSSMVIPHTD